MINKITSWPHAPEHRLCERGTYIVTCGTYRKQHFLNTPKKLTLVRNLLFELAQKYDWRLQAWAIMSNHYHFVASSPTDPASLKKMLSTLHTLSAATLNRMDGQPKRRVWYNYYDSRITYEKSWLARLKYVHQNPVHHGVVQSAELYEWCSATWFAREGGNAFVKTVNSFKIDQVKVYDEYSNMECAGSTALSNTVARQPSKSSVDPEHSKEATPQFKSAVKPAHSAPSAQKQPHRCKYCNSTDLVKAGTRKLKSGVKQLYKCNGCLRKFSSLNRNAKQTDPDIILKALIAACRSYTYEEIQRFVERRYQKHISTSVISKWVKEYNPPYLKMRERNETVTRVVISNVFTHRDLNYNFQVHVPKLALCPLRNLKEYLIKLPTLINHELFETADRCSQLKTDIDIAVKHSQDTQACKDALKALQFAKTNYQRHDVVEQFMLNCDTYTIAAEVPVWMSHMECGGLDTAFKQGGSTPDAPAKQQFKSSVKPEHSKTAPPQFKSAVEPAHSKQVIAGHIDLLQWKFNTLYVLDFKPNAKKENKQKVATQLSLYAMALSCRTGVPLNRMRCAWFDGEDFFSFSPLECDLECAGSTSL